MKLENFCYSVAMKTLELLENQHHYKIPADVKKEIVENPNRRRALHERFMESQKIAQKDPWSKQAIDGIEEREFTPLTLTTQSHG